MPFNVNCPECGLSLSVPDEAMGKKGRCSQCENIFVIGTTEQPAAGSSPDQTPPPPNDMGAPPPPPPPLGADFGGSPPPPVPEQSNPYASPTFSVAPVGSRMASERAELVDNKVMDFGTGLSNGISLYTNSFGLFLGIGAVFTIVSFAIAFIPQCIPYLGILIGIGAAIGLTPQIGGGFMLGAIKEHDGRRPEVGTLFEEFSQWGTYALMALIQVVIGIGLFIVPGILAWAPFVFMIIEASNQNRQPEPEPIAVLLMVAGFILYLISILIVNMIFLWAPAIIADQRCGVVEAISKSWTITKNNFFATFGCIIIANLLGSIGAILCGVGLILTISFRFTIIAACYRTVYSLRPVSNLETTTEQPISQPNENPQSDGQYDNFFE